jgi:RNA polymerase sigma-70 factor (ECF subfamily)
VTGKGPDSSLRDDLVAAIPNMRAFAMSLCGNRDRADDLVQEALVKAWNHLDSFEVGTNLKAWLFTILRNAYFSELRKTKREVADSEGLIAARVAVPAEQHAHLELKDLGAALTALPPDQREALILVGAEGFSYEDAASISGCAVGTVKSRVNRARAKLNELMATGRDEEQRPAPAKEKDPKRAKGARERFHPPPRNASRNA